MANGGGIMGWMVNGKRVAFAAQSADLQGIWAEYAVVPALNCVAIDDALTFEVR